MGFKFHVACMRLVRVRREAAQDGLLVHGLDGSRTQDEATSTWLEGKWGVFFLGSGSSCRLVSFWSTPKFGGR